MLFAIRRCVTLGFRWWWVPQEGAELSKWGQEALVRGAGLGTAPPNGAALPQRREPQQVEERGAELGAVKVMIGQAGPLSVDR